MSELLLRDQTVRLYLKLSWNWSAYPWRTPWSVPTHKEPTIWFTQNQTKQKNEEKH